jgi:hypothetical protein
MTDERVLHGGLTLPHRFTMAERIAAMMRSTRRRVRMNERDSGE